MRVLCVVSPSALTPAQGGRGRDGDQPACCSSLVSFAVGRAEPGSSAEVRMTNKLSNIFTSGLRRLRAVKNNNRIVHTSPALRSLGLVKYFRLKTGRVTHFCPLPGGGLTVGLGDQPVPLH